MRPTTRTTTRAGGHERRVSGFDDGASQLADDLDGALAEYAGLYRTAAEIAADGGTADELAEWSSACFGEAVSLRLLEEDSIGFATDVPEDAGVLVRELYESLVVLSGVERPAHALSMPVSTCASGSSLATLLREKGELARWFAKVAVRPLMPPELPATLLARESRVAAHADRDLIEEERPKDLNDVFAGRLIEAIRLYGDAVVFARTETPGSALQASLTASAREEAPALIGFARLADRRIVGLDPPAEAASIARFVADGFVTLAAAETAEDIATLPYPSAEEVEDAARPLRNWLARLGTV
jgi:hypothetical protein